MFAYNRWPPSAYGSQWGKHPRRICSFATACIPCHSSAISSCSARSGSQSEFQKEAVVTSRITRITSRSPRPSQGPPKRSVCGHPPCRGLSDEQDVSLLDVDAAGLMIDHGAVVRRDVQNKHGRRPGRFRIPRRPRRAKQDSRWSQDGAPRQAQVVFVRSKAALPSRVLRCRTAGDSRGQHSRREARSRPRRSCGGRS